GGVADGGRVQALKAAEEEVGDCQIDVVIVPESAVEALERREGAFVRPDRHLATVQVAVAEPTVSGTPAEERGRPERRNSEEGVPDELDFGQPGARKAEAGIVEDDAVV